MSLCKETQQDVPPSTESVFCNQDVAEPSCQVLNLKCKGTRAYTLNQ